jgi:hypothetical protein
MNEGSFFLTEKREEKRRKNNEKHFKSKKELAYP